MKNIGFWVVFISSATLAATVFYLGYGFWLSLAAWGLFGLLLSLIYNLFASLFGWKRIPVESMIFW